MGVLRSVSEKLWQPKEFPCDVLALVLEASNGGCCYFVSANCNHFCLWSLVLNFDRSFKCISDCISWICFVSEVNWLAFACLWNLSLVERVNIWLASSPEIRMGISKPVHMTLTSVCVCRFKLSATVLELPLHSVLCTANFESNSL